MNKKTITITANKEDENFFFNELNYYTRLYFDYQCECVKKHDNETLDYLKGFVAYCKDKIYFFASELTKLKEQKGE